MMLSPIDDHPATVVLSRDSSMSSRRGKIEMSSPDTYTTPGMDISTGYYSVSLPNAFAGTSSVTGLGIHAPKMSLQAQVEFLLRQNAAQNQLLRDMYSSLRVQASQASAVIKLFFLAFYVC